VCVCACVHACVRAKNRLSYFLPRFPSFNESSSARNPRDSALEWWVAAENRVGNAQ